MDNQKITLPNKETLAKMSISELKDFFGNNAIKFSDAEVFTLSSYISQDNRQGAKLALDNMIKVRNAHNEEKLRVKKLYDFQQKIAVTKNANILGLDEVGRGPLAGPLTVGGVILKEYPMILGLNDSKKISAKKREEISKEIKDKAIAWKTFSIPPKYIDDLGMTACLKNAFSNIIKQIEDEGVRIDVVLLDGNPLSVDRREVNVIKGDMKCASISAASIVAKVTRDTYMEKISDDFPQYNFAQNKGYGTAEHIDAIKKYGLSNIHRKSFCSSFMQTTLF